MDQIGGVFGIAHQAIPSKIQMVKSRFAQFGAKIKQLAQAPDRCFTFVTLRDDAPHLEQVE